MQLYVSIFLIFLKNNDVLYTLFYIKNMSVGKISKIEKALFFSALHNFFSAIFLNNNFIFLIFL